MDLELTGDPKHPSTHPYDTVWGHEFSAFKIKVCPPMKSWKVSMSRKWDQGCMHVRSLNIFSTDVLRLRGTAPHPVTSPSPSIILQERPEPNIGQHQSVGNQFLKDAGQTPFLTDMCDISWHHGSSWRPLAPSFHRVLVPPCSPSGAELKLCHWSKLSEIQI